MTLLARGCSTCNKTRDSHLHGQNLGVPFQREHLLEGAEELVQVSPKGLFVGVSRRPAGKGPSRTGNAHKAKPALYDGDDTAVSTTFYWHTLGSYWKPLMHLYLSLMQAGSMETSLCVLAASVSVSQFYGALQNSSLTQTKEQNKQRTHRGLNKSRIRRDMIPSIREAEETFRVTWNEKERELSKETPRSQIF